MNARCLQLPRFLQVTCSLLVCFFGLVSLTFAETRQVTSAVDLNTTVVLHGSRPAWVGTATDVGPKAVGDEIKYASLLLARTQAQQAAFTAFLDSQQNTASPNYHQWITPQQVGELYGPAQADVNLIVAWLEGQGLRVDEVEPSRTVIHFTGSAGQIGAAFKTEFRNYSFTSTSGGAESRFAPSSEPQVPAAFANIIAGIHGISTSTLRPTSHISTVQNQQPVAGNSGITPLYTSGSGNHYTTPGDFATIYDINSVHASYTGANQHVAIIGLSRVYSGDITQYQSKTGVTFNTPNVIIPSPSGTDPGTPCSTQGQSKSSGTCQDNGDQGEQTLDVQRVGGTAPGSIIDLVVSGGNNGLDIALSYAVNSLNATDKIITMSYGGCEVDNGIGGVDYFDNLYSIAAAAGVSVFVSSGDSGVNGCGGGTTPSNSQDTSINALCSSQYDTCVGGTEFNEGGSPSTYWATSGSNPNTALGYIPEGVWNEPLSGSTPQYAASGGGYSVYVATPSWQTGTGVPASKQGRYTPDVAFDSANHDGYYGCFAYVDGGCTSSFTIFSGTSAAAPSMAGIVALLNQKTGTSEGNMNPKIYSLAASSPTAFNDVTVTSSGVSGCVVTTASMCNNSTPGPSGVTGGQPGYLVNVGYDEATGWGSLDVAKFFTAWTGSSLATPTLALTSSPSSVAINQVITLTATLSGTPTPTGTVTFYNGATAIGSAVTLSSGVATTTYTPTSAGSYTFSYTYSGDTKFSTQTSSNLVVSVSTYAPTISNTTISSTSFAIGASTTISATVTGHSGIAVPTGTVTFTATTGGVATTISNCTQSLASNGIASCVFTPTAGGTYSIAFNYPGDSNYSSLTYNYASSVTVTKANTTTTLSPSTNSALPSANVTLTATVSTSIGNPTGTVTFYATPSGGSQQTLGTGTLSGSGTATTATYVGTLPLGVDSVTASYGGSGTFNTSSSSASTVTVAKTTVSIAITPNFTTLSTNQSGTFNVAYSGGSSLNAGNLTVTSTSGTDTFSLPASTSAGATILLTAPGTNTSTSAVTVTATYSDTNNSGTQTYTFTPTAAMSYSPAISNITASAAGQSGSGTLTLTTTGGFDPTAITFNAITFSGVPTGVPTTATLSSFTKVDSTHYTATFSLTTTAGAIRKIFTAGVGEPNTPSMLLIFFSMLLFLGFKDKPVARRVAMILLLLVGLISIGACGGGGSASSATPTGTTTITATISNGSTAASTSTGTVGGYPSLTASTSFSLNVL